MGENLILEGLRCEGLAEGLVVDDVHDTGAAIEDFVNLPATLNEFADLPGTGHKERVFGGALNEALPTFKILERGLPLHRRIGQLLFPIYISAESPYPLELPYYGRHLLSSSNLRSEGPHEFIFG